MSDRALTFILGGGAGTRLSPLTLLRCKPAVPLAGKYRLIDIPMSNAINSGLTRIYVLTQFNSHSLNNHVARTYLFDRFHGGYVHIVAANQTPQGDRWFQGTADAVRQCLRVTAEVPHDTVVILSGDHLYRMDYRRFLETHVRSGADATVAAQRVAADGASSLGLMHTDGNGIISRFSEKPEGAALERMRVDQTQRPFLASMGIYIFRRDVLDRVLNEELVDAVDFGKEVLPRMLGDYRLAAHPFDGYWADIGTIPAFFEANMALTIRNPPFSFFDPQAPIYTRARSLPASRVRDCHVEDSILNEGCTLEGASIKNSILGLRSRISRGVSLERVMVMGADRIQPPDEVAADLARGLAPFGVGEGSRVRHAILDKDVRIGRNVRITNEPGHLEADGEGWSIRDGVVVVHKNAVIPDGTVI